MEILQIGLILACVAAILLLYIAPAAWAVGDAMSRGQLGWALALFFLFWMCGPLTALLWWAVRPGTMVPDRSPDTYADADEALTAASRLDYIGEWDAAITLYEDIAKRWPEHHQYIANCVEHIKSRQALT